MSDEDKQLSELMSIYTSHNIGSVLQLIKQLIDKVDVYINQGAVVGRKLYRHTVNINDDHDTNFNVVLYTSEFTKIDSVLALKAWLGDPDYEMPLLVRGEYDQLNITQAYWKAMELYVITSGGTEVIDLTSEYITITDDIKVM